MECNGNGYRSRMHSSIMNHNLAIDDEDEEIIQFLMLRNRPRIFRDRVDHLNKWDELDFFRRFRMKKPTFMYVLGKIENGIMTTTNRNYAISPMQKLLIALRFYATGNFLITAGELVGISEPSASRIVKEVSFALAVLRPEYVKMPQTNEELQQASYAFYKIARMPRIIGAIDCTHVRVQSPGGENAEYFRNRKGYFSLNIQTVAAADLRILDIVARWPDSVHDQTIFMNSKLKKDLEDGRYSNYMIVADSGYANSKHIVTPFLNTTNRAECLYNESLIRTRNVVEREYGVWKRRFPVLFFGFGTKLETTMAGIVACAVLFNITRSLENEEPPSDPDLSSFVVTEQPSETHLQQSVSHHSTARERLINDYFSFLVN